MRRYKLTSSLFPVPFVAGVAGEGVTEVEGPAAATSTVACIPLLTIPVTTKIGGCVAPPVTVTGTLGRAAVCCTVSGI